MTHILYYVLAICFNLLGLNIQQPIKIDRTSSILKITEILASDTSIKLEDQDSTFHTSVLATDIEKEALIKFKNLK